jgi:hypothetical protein
MPNWEMGMGKEKEGELRSSNCLFISQYIILLVE